MGTVLSLLSKSYMLKAATILGLALDQSDKNAAKMREKAIRENEEWVTDGAGEDGASGFVPLGARSGRRAAA